MVCPDPAGPHPCVGEIVVTYFRILEDAASHAFTYLLADLTARRAVLIDPHVADLSVLRALLSEHDLHLSWVLRTHHHGDWDVQAALAMLGAPLVQGNAGAFGRPGEDGVLLKFGHEHLRVLATPGHTPNCLSFAWRDRLFCGDLLSVDGCREQPHPSLPEAVWDSVTQRIFTLPDETLLFCGHSSRSSAVSTVMEQRHWHPWFAKMTRDEFLTRIAKVRSDNTDVFA